MRLKSTGPHYRGEPGADPGSGHHHHARRSEQPADQRNTTSTAALTFNVNMQHQPNGTWKAGALMLADLSVPVCEPARGGW